MQLTEEQIRLIFGLKLKQIRAEKDLSLFGLSKLTGLSKSYLNEIEKGKKYPKPDKVVAIAKALETPYDEMVSMKLTGTMAPLSDIIMSGILKEIPLELFGIEEGNLIDIIANAPEKVTAFIATLFEISRNYNVTRESFYLAALRSYQESHENYFPEIEAEVKTFAKRYQVDLSEKISSKDLEDILTQEFGYTLDFDSLSEEDYPESIRSVFVPKIKKLLIAKTVSETQLVFILAKELGYAHMNITQRPLTFTWIKFEQFEDVLNNFKASYFAGALLLPEDKLVAELKEFFKQETWSAEGFLELLSRYTDSAETFFQRLTNLLPKQLGMPNLFFLRLAHNSDLTRPYVTKELHVTRTHQPHLVRGREHYCQRWVSSDLILHPDQYPKKDDVHIGIQRSFYHDSKDEYLVLSASNTDPFRNNKNRSVCIGIEMSAKQKKKVKFADDQSIPSKTVGVTCERCGVVDCKVRASEPVIYDRQKRNVEIEKRISELLENS